MESTIKKQYKAPTVRHAELFSALSLLSGSTFDGQTFSLGGNTPMAEEDI